MFFVVSSVSITVKKGVFAASSALPPEGLPATDMAAANKSYKRDFNDCITPTRQKKTRKPICNRSPNGHMIRKSFLSVQFCEDFPQFLALSQLLKSDFGVSFCVTVADKHSNVASHTFCSESGFGE